LFAVGNNIGDPEDIPLIFAGEDARRVAALFKDVGEVSSDRAYLLIDQPVTVLREQFAELAGRIAELARNGNNVELVLYVSAHARAGVLHLHGGHFTLAQLREMAEHTAARVRVLVIDACDSGAAVRPKGGSLGPEYEVQLEQLPLGGTVIISSSGPAEPSQEWDSLGGSLFTHHLLTGLRGDADTDHDGRVTLAEAYAYTYRRTVLEAISLGQHPSFDLDLAGSGELVLSAPAASRGAVVFPADLEGRYVLASQPRPDVVAEVHKLRGSALRLAVPPGRYALRKLLDRTTGLLILQLPYGGEVVVDETAMVRRSFVEIAVKGGAVELHPWSVLVLGQVETAPFPSTWGRWRAGLSARRTEGEWWMQASLTAGNMGYRAQQLSISERSVALGLAGGYRWLLTPVALYAGLQAELVAVEQRFVRDNEAYVQNAYGVGPIPAAHALGISLGPTVGLEVPLTPRFYTWISGSALIRELPVDGRSLWTFGAQGALGVGWIF
jgi:hypothetical protein